MHCSIAGFYKRAIQEYKNILILTFNRFVTRKNQGDKPITPPFARFSGRLSACSCPIACDIIEAFRPLGFRFRFFL